MTVLTIVIVVTAAWWFVDMYRWTGRATEEKLPRPTLRDRKRLRKSFRDARREHDFLLRECVRTPDREDVQLALAHAQVLFVLADALRKRDSKLAAIATDAMKQTRTTMVEAREARAYAAVYRERQAAVN